jgi:predicted nucleic-acid-binding protein
MIFVDTNYFVRIIENDDEGQAKKAEKLFLKGAAGEEKLTSSGVVLFEIYWLMKSFYGKKKNDLTMVLRDVLALNFIKWGNGKVLTEAVEMMKKTNYDLEDAYNLVYARSGKADEMASFDIKLQKIWKKG